MAGESLSIAVICRKAHSAVFRLMKWAATRKTYLSTLGRPEIRVGAHCEFGRGVRLQATDGGAIVLGARVALGDGVQLVAHGGTMTVGDDVFIGTGSIVVCRQEVMIGNGSQIAEYVVIRDQDHRTDSRPMRTAGFRTAALNVGSDVWIGTKASILLGGSVGDRSVIGAHALVRAEIPSDVLAAGVPATIIRPLGESGPCQQK